MRKEELQKADDVTDFVDRKLSYFIDLEEGNRLPK